MPRAPPVSCNRVAAFKTCRGERQPVELPSPVGAAELGFPSKENASDPNFSFDYREKILRAPGSYQVVILGVSGTQDALNIRHLSIGAIIAAPHALPNR